MSSTSGSLPAGGETFSLIGENFLNRALTRTPLLGGHRTKEALPPESLPLTSLLGSGTSDRRDLLLKVQIVE